MVLLRRVIPPPPDLDAYLARYFTEAETKDLHPELVWRLDLARDIAGIPFIITSGYRSQGENEAAGGVTDSEHTDHPATGVDLKAHTSRERFLIVGALVLAGFSRIGVYNRHVHAGVSKTRPQDVTWVGTST